MKNYTEEEKEMINGVLEYYTNHLFGTGLRDTNRLFGTGLREFQEANGLTPKLIIKTTTKMSVAQLEAMFGITNLEITK
jgi:hypothetical protein